mgnify:CR=1 FL=1|nr:MetS family NSS transporter small subunit [uncultured Solibaculum sp.]
MNISAICVMLFAIIFIWGGFFFTLGIEIRHSNKGKKSQQEQNDSHSGHQDTE